MLLGLQNALLKEENVLVNAINLAQCSKPLIALILLTSDCHISVQFVEMFSNLQPITCKIAALSFP